MIRVSTADTIGRALQLSACLCAYYGTHAGKIGPLAPSPPGCCSCAATSRQMMGAGEEQLRVEAKERREAVASLEKSLRAEKDALSSVEAKLALLVASAAKAADAAGGRMKETALRSLVKAIGWRFTAGFVTFCTSFYFTGGDWATAGKIVGSDFLSKSGTMYVGERLFNKVDVGRSSSGAENPMRSIIKALVWRVFAFAQTMVVSLFLIKKVGGYPRHGSCAAAAVARGSGNRSGYRSDCAPRARACRSGSQSGEGARVTLLFVLIASPFARCVCRRLPALADVPPSAPRPRWERRSQARTR